MSASIDSIVRVVEVVTRMESGSTSDDRFIEPLDCEIYFVLAPRGGGTIEGTMKVTSYEALTFDSAKDIVVDRLKDRIG